MPHSTARPAITHHLSQFLMLKIYQKQTEGCDSMSQVDIMLPWWGKLKEKKKKTTHYRVSGLNQLRREDKDV